MRVNFILSLIVLTAICLPASCLALEAQSIQNDDLALEVFQMHQSLDQLIDLMKSQQSKNDDILKLQTVISYLSFRYRSIEMKQYDLRFKKEQRDGIEALIERQKEEEDEAKKTFQANSTLTARDKKKPVFDIERMEERLERLDQDISKKESEIQFEKSELSRFESYVQEKLGLID